MFKNFIKEIKEWIYYSKLSKAEKACYYKIKSEVKNDIK